MNKQGLSGYTIVRNAIKGDYCIRESLLSMLPICDEVVVGDASSDDGTTEMLTVMASKHPKIRVVRQEWVQPNGNPKWFVSWINLTRRELRFDTQLMLDADEVLGSGCYKHLKALVSTGTALWCSRLNFWRNAQTLIAKGETCGHEVVRFGPSDLFMPSDEPYGFHPHFGPEPVIRRRAKRIHPMPVIFHYGFLRKREGMIEKSKVNLRAFFGGFDTRLSKAMLHPEKPWQDFLIHKKPHTRYDGPHPKHCHEWLKERGAI